MFEKIAKARLVDPKSLAYAQQQLAHAIWIGCRSSRTSRASMLVGRAQTRKGSIKFEFGLRLANLRTNAYCSTAEGRYKKSTVFDEPPPKRKSICPETGNLIET